MGRNMEVISRKKRELTAGAALGFGPVQSSAKAEGLELAGQKVGEAPLSLDGGGIGMASNPTSSDNNLPPQPHKGPPPPQGAGLAPVKKQQGPYVDTGDQIGHMFAGNGLVEQGGGFGQASHNLDSISGTDSDPVIGANLGQTVNNNEPGSQEDQNPGDLLEAPPGSSNSAGLTDISPVNPAPLLEAPPGNLIDEPMIPPDQPVLPQPIDHPMAPQAGIRPHVTLPPKPALSESFCAYVTFPTKPILMKSFCTYNNISKVIFTLRFCSAICFIQYNNL